jgi:hypothetical protein
MNNATDHGYNTDWTIKVRPGLVCSCAADGATAIQKYRVTDRHAANGFWKVIMLDGPEVGNLFDISERRILADAYTP